MPMAGSIAARTEAFCRSFDVRVPILLAPMAGACPPSLSIAVAQSGGFGACGALLMQPGAIKAWAAEARAGSNGAFQINLWIPDPPPSRDPAREAAMRTFLGTWGPEVPPDAGDAPPPDFAAQCEAIEKSGGDSFMEYMVPHAALRLKQGFGRLIRSTADRGAVVLCDPRVLRKGYGAHLLEALPPARRAVAPWAVLRETLRAFYANAPLAP